MSPLDTLLALQGHLQPGELVEMRAVQHATGELRREWFGSYRALMQDAIDLSPHGWNTWYGINPRRGRLAGDGACTRATSLPADIDAKLWADDLGAAAATLAAFGLPPSANIASGGGYQPRWLLAETLDLQDAAQVRRYRIAATRLGRAVCGADRRADTISNPERILRVPGSLNWKYSPARPVTIEYCEPTRRYSIEAIENWLDRHAPWTALTTPIERPAAPTEKAGDGVIGDFNARYDLVGLLLRHGATVAGSHGGVTHFTRPGKHEGTSATWNYHPGVLIVFSEAWPPFAAWSIAGQRRRGYDAFEAYTLLEHNGNRSQAYRAAMDAGYGVTEICGLPVRSMNGAAALRSLIHRGSRCSQIHENGKSPGYCESVNSVNPGSN